MDRLISLQAAIDAMCELMHHWFGGDPKDEIREIKRELEKLPPAQQENDWTPVSKKKHPDKEGEYLVTDDAGGMAEVDKDVFMFLDDGTLCWLYSQNVTAWRELPEPYVERQKE